MSKLNLKIGTLCCLLAWVGFGCEMDQEVNMPAHEPRLAVRLALTNMASTPENYQANQNTQLFVGRSQSIFYTDESLNGLANAEATLYDADGQVVEVYAHKGLYYGYDQPQEVQGYYEPTKGFVPSPGGTYTLKASSYKLPPVEATITMPEETAVPALSFERRTSATYTYGITGDLKVTIADQAGEKNYYRIRAWPLDSVYSRIDSYGASSIDEYDQSLLGDNDRLQLNRLFTDELYTSGTINFLTRISFGSRSYPMFEGDKGRTTRYLEVQVQQLSEDEYLYFKTEDAQYRTEDNPFAEPINVHSNVRDGYGVLGGMTVSKFYIAL